jgi:transposase
MSEWIAELVERLVVKRKRDGRCVYDEQAKVELVLACRERGVSISKLARRCGINANQLSGWIRRYERERVVTEAANASGVPAISAPAFVPVQITSSVRSEIQNDQAAIAIQAKLPNGVVLELKAGDLEQASKLIEKLGGLRCFASMTN